MPDRDHTSLRIGKGTLAAIDVLLTKRTGTVSRNTWIMEAIAEKLERDAAHPSKGGEAADA